MNSNYNPLVSVVIPVHNRRATIERCLNSVLSQDYDNFEIVIGDDASTDDTLDVIASMNSEKIRVISYTPNGGAQKARNEAIKAANGEWIAFLDSDDEFLPHKLKEQVEVLRQHDFRKDMVVFSDAVLCNATTGEKRPYGLQYWGTGNFYSKYLQRSNIFFQVMMVSKEALLNIGLLDESVPAYQEWDTAIRLSKENIFCQMDHPTFEYYYHEGEMISKNRTREIEGYLFVVRKHEQEIKRVNGIEGWRMHFKELYKRCLLFKLDPKKYGITQELSLCDRIYVQLRARAGEAYRRLRKGKKS